MVIISIVTEVILEPTKILFPDLEFVCVCPEYSPGPGGHLGTENIVEVLLYYEVV